MRAFLMMVLICAITTTTVITGMTATAEEEIGQSTRGTSTLPDGTYLNITIDRKVADTSSRVTIVITSAVATGMVNNTTMFKPNTGVVNIFIYDVDQDLTIKEQTVLYFGGVVEYLLLVEPTWTTSLIRVTAIDYALGLISQDEFNTEMSDEYLLWLAQTMIYENIVQFQEQSDKDKEAIISRNGNLMVSITGLIIFISFGASLRHDHRLSHSVGRPSYWDRFVNKAWPFSMVPNYNFVWLDPNNTWDPEAARDFQQFRLDAHVKHLEDEKKDIDNEIQLVKEHDILLEKYQKEVKQ